MPDAQPNRRIHRRAYNYDDLPTGTGISNSGLLNEWTTPAGSAVFAIPPRCDPTGFIGDTLLRHSRSKALLVERAIPLGV